MAGRGVGRASAISVHSGARLVTTSTQIVMKMRVRIVAVAALSAAIPATMFAAWFHLALKRSVPADKSVVATAPTELKLYFSERPEVAVTKIVLLDGKDTIPVAKPTMAKADTAPLIAKIAKAIGPGSYTVNWRTMGDDGHAVTGAFRFTVAAGARGTGRQ